MTLTDGEKAKEIEKWLKNLIKEHEDCFKDVYQHIALYGYITEEEIEKIVTESLNKKRK
jgi:hypothetical protein